MRLTDFLEDYDGTDAEFAEAIGVSAQALSRYRLGKRRPEWDVLDRIRRVTEGAVTPNDFLDAVEAPTPGAPA